MFGKIAETTTSRSNQRNGNKLSKTVRIDRKSLEIDPKSMKNPWKSTPNRVKIETESVKR